MNSPPHVSQKHLLGLEEMELYRDELQQELQEVQQELQELEMEEFQELEKEELRELEKEELQELEKEELQKEELQELEEELQELEKEEQLMKTSATSTRNPPGEHTSSERACKEATTKKFPTNWAPKHPSPLLFSRTASEQRGSIHLTPPKEHARETEEPLLRQLLTYFVERRAWEAKKVKKAKKAKKARKGKKVRENSAK